VSAREIGDCALQRIGPSLLTRRPGHHNSLEKGARRGGSLESVAIDHEREAGRGQGVRAVLNTEVEVGIAAVAAVAEQAKYLTASDVLTGSDADRAGLQVRVVCVLAAPDSFDHVIAEELNRSADRWNASAR